MSDNQEAGASFSYDPFLYTVQGQLLNQAAPAEVCQGLVQLFHLGADANPATEPVVTEEATLDEFGFFAFQLTTGGFYRLVALLPQHTIWIQALHVP